MSDMQVVVFNLNQEVCGAETSQIKEIVRYQDVSKAPGMPEFMEGMINLRGAVIPVVNLNKRFHQGQEVPTRKTKIIIARVNNQMVGFMVNDVSEILRLSGETVEAAPPALRALGNRYLKYVAKKGELLISILDMEAILEAHEVESMLQQGA